MAQRLAGLCRNLRRAVADGEALAAQRRRYGAEPSGEWPAGLKLDESAAWVKKNPVFTAYEYRRDFYINEFKWTPGTLTFALVAGVLFPVAMYEGVCWALWLEDDKAMRPRKAYWFHDPPPPRGEDD